MSGTDDQLQTSPKRSKQTTARNRADTRAGPHAHSRTTTRIHLRIRALRAPNPGRASAGSSQASRGREHPRVVPATHNSELPKHIGQAAAPVPPLGGARERSVRRLPDKLHGPRTEAPMHLKGDRAYRMPGAGVILQVQASFQAISGANRAAGLPGGAAYIAGSQSVDKGDISQDVPGPEPQVAMQIPEAHVGALTAGGEAQPANVLPEQVNRAR